MIRLDLLRELLGYAGHSHTGGLDGPAATGVLPVGTIIAWHGSSASLPADWRVCDGGAGTPNLTNRFIKGAQDDSTPGTTPGSTGGQDSYNLSHAHNMSISISTAGSHTHTGYMYRDGGSPDHGQNAGNSGTFTSDDPHGHSITWTDVGANHAHTGFGSVGANLGVVESRPPFHGLFYAQRIALTSSAAANDGRPFYHLQNIQALWRRLWLHDHAEHRVGQIPVGAVVNLKAGMGTPTGFADCDGASGTPDLRGKFLVTAGSSYGLNATGGVATNDYSHAHTSSGSTSTDGSHTHTISVPGGDSNVVGNSYNDETGWHDNPVDGHTHTVTDNASGSHGHGVTPSVSNAGGAYDNQPGYHTLRYVKRIS